MMDNEKKLSPKNRRLEQERKHRRNTIIKIAEKSFIEQGFAQSMIEQIAKDAGYSKATIYNYFESKEDLFIATLTKAFEKLFLTFEENIIQPDKKNLRSLGDAYIIFLEKYPREAKLFNHDVIGSVLRRIINKELSQSVQPENKRNQLTESEQAGIAKELTFEVIMVLSKLDSAIRELLVDGVTSGDPESSKRYLNVLFNIVDKGLKHYND